MASLTESTHAGEFMIREFDLDYNRETITVASGEDLTAGAVLGKATLGAATGEHDGSATGDSTFSAIVVDAAANVGAYRGTFTAATKATIEDPLGVTLGTLTLGSEFSAGGITLTMTAGSTPHVAGDVFTITVEAGSGKYVELDTSGTDGTATAAGILYAAVDASTADADGVAVVRGPVLVNANELVWPTGITNDQKTAALADLAALNIIAR